MPPVKQTAIRGSQVLPELYCPESAWSYWILGPSLRKTIFVASARTPLLL